MSGHRVDRIFLLTYAILYAYNVAMKTRRAKLEVERKRLVKKLVRLDPWIQGTVVEMKRICGSEGCRCRAGGPKHPAVFLTWKENQKTCCLYVPRRLEREVKLWARNYRRVKALMGRMTELGRDVIRLRER